tara:strand:+ start:44 stop:364 length:321 start_codon:yes stop_codon:yes gene_type:complete
MKWINTKVEFGWDGSQYTEQYSEGYWYDGEMALCNMQSSGEIKFSDVWREHYETSGTPTSTISLHDYSISAYNGSGSYAQWFRVPQMTFAAPYALSEFYQGIKPGI